MCNPAPAALEAARKRHDGAPHIPDEEWIPKAERGPPNRSRGRRVPSLTKRLVLPYTRVDAGRE